MMAENKRTECRGWRYCILLFLSKSRGLCYYILLFLSSLIIGLSLAVISEKFIFKEGIKRFTARLTSPAIGDNFYIAAEDVKKKIKISVFAFDDGDLQEFKQTYPLSYSFHARMLDNIGEMSPKAVFLDIWFHDERPDPTINLLVDAICRLHKSGTRVYLASLSHLGGAENQLRKELREIVVPATGLNDLSGKPGFCAVEVSVGKTTDALDRQMWEYPLSSNPKHQQVYSAAAQIYNDLSGQKPLPLSASPLALIWGTEGSETNRSNADENSSCRNKWYWQELIPVPSALHGFLRFPAEIAKPFCTYHTTLPLRAFMGIGGIPSENLQPLIENRVIIYGGNLQSDADIIYSPVHGRLPGLQLHAMALDNLFYYGAEYPKAEKFDPFNYESGGTLFPLFIVFIFSLLATVIHWLRKSGQRRLCRRKWRKVLGDIELFTKKPWREVLGKIELFTKKSIERLPAWLVVLSTSIGKISWSLITWLASWVLKGAIVVILLFTMAYFGLKIFHLGPLSWIVYAILPIVMEFLHWGESTAKWSMQTIMQLRRACCSNNHNGSNK